MENRKDESEPTLRWIAERAVDETQFFPAWGRARLEAMMKTRPDWCVSRQRNWGVPIPFFLHKESGQPHPRSAELIEQVAQRVEKAGIEAWFSLDAVARTTWRLLVSHRRLREWNPSSEVERQMAGRQQAHRSELDACLRSKRIGPLLAIGQGCWLV